MSSIIIPLPEGGSDWGFSFWDTWLVCREKARLNKLQEEKGDTKPYFLLGTMFHAYMEHYYLHGVYNPADVEFTGPGSEKEELIVEAQTLITRYMEKFGPGELGKVIGAEVPVGGTDDDWEEVAMAVGAFPLMYTCRIDLVVKISKAQAKKIEKTRRIKLEPGYYLVDHKTAKSIRDGLILYYERSKSCKGYQIAWNAAHPKMPVKGMLVNIITKHKLEARFLTVVSSYPSIVERAHIRAYFEYIRQLKASAVPQKNPGQCITFDGGCHHFGVCRGF